MSLDAGRGMTLLQRGVREALIRAFDEAFLRSCGIMPDLEPTSEEAACL